MTSDLAAFQAAVGKWHRQNFSEASSIEIALKLASEVGELAHACGLLHGGLVTAAGLLRQEKDAVGDIMVVLAAYCEKRGLDMQGCIEMAWREVRQRDYRAHPETAGRGGDGE